MPRKSLERKWCKTCNEFKLHERYFMKKELRCKTCNTEYSEIKLSEIPKEKLVLQRKRYTESVSRNFNNMISGYLSLGLLQAFSDFDNPDVIKESDVGQIKIDQIERRKQEEYREKMYLKRQELLKLKQKFHNLGRNEKCLCGSEKKYKKCCWTKIQKI